MKKISVFFLALILLGSCSSAPTPDESFFYPVRTLDELMEMEGEFDYINFVHHYEVVASEPNRRLNQITDIVWLNGRLFVSDNCGLRGGGIHVFDSDLNHIDTITQTPDHSIVSAYALATDENGNLYAVINISLVGREISFDIAVFDADLNYERAIPFTIISRTDAVWPKSLAVNPDGGFYLALRGEEDKAEDGVIYSISESGAVTAGPGNASFGYLLALPDRLFFVNSCFHGVRDRDAGGYINKNGLSALYMLQKGAVTEYTVIPPSYRTPFSEEEIEEWIAAFSEITGEPPSPEVVSESRERGYLVGIASGSGGLFRLGDNVAVISQFSSVMHVFDTELSYLYSHRIDNGLAEMYKESSSLIFRRNIAACADDEGNIYIVQSIFSMGSQGYGILKGTPNR
jgi:hypothetical protein